MGCPTAPSGAATAAPSLVGAHAEHIREHTAADVPSGDPGRPMLISGVNRSPTTSRAFATFVEQEKQLPWRDDQFDDAGSCADQSGLAGVGSLSGSHRWEWF